jgi:hypothetical protein
LSENTRHINYKDEEELASILLNDKNPILEQLRREFPLVKF